MKNRLLQFLVLTFMYLIPSAIVLTRHTSKVAQDSTVFKVSIGGMIFLIAILYRYAKNKNDIMAIRKAKEIEDNKRKIKTILYYYMKFAIMFVGAYLVLHLIKLNFTSLIITMDMIGVSLLIGSLLRIHLANVSGL